MRQDRRLSVPTFRPPTRRFTNPPTRRSAASAGMSRRLGQPALGRLKVKFKARRARRASRLRVKRVRRLFEARRFAPSSGRGAPKPAQKRRDARVEETRRETTASAGRAPRRGQGCQARSLQLRISGVAKGRRNDPRSEAFFAVFGFRFDGEREATPRQAHWLARQAAESGFDPRASTGRRRLARRGCAANPPKRRPQNELARNWAIGRARLGDAAPGRYGIGAACTT